MVQTWITQRPRGAALTSVRGSAGDAAPRSSWQPRSARAASSILCTRRRSPASSRRSFPRRPNWSTSAGSPSWCAPWACGAVTVGRRWPRRDCCSLSGPPTCRWRSMPNAATSSRRKSRTGSGYRSRYHSSGVPCSRADSIDVRVNEAALVLNGRSCVVLAPVQDQRSDGGRAQDAERTQTAT